MTEVTEMLSAMNINYQLVPNFSAEHEYNVVYDQSVPYGTEVTVGDRMNKVLIYYGAQEFSSEESYWPGEDEDENPGVIIIDRG